ncbi:proliferating cell nuclear antigen [Trifolium repens]|nr:proliferating cell nuclear antigen [Trifolium repens]
MMKQEHTRAFKHERNSITPIISLDCNDIVITGTFQHLSHIVKIHTHRKITVTAIMFKPFRTKQKSNQSNMARIHGLKGETGGRTIEVSIGDQFFDRFENFLEK